jgi:hypothetical protein
MARALQRSVLIMDERKQTPPPKEEPREVLPSHDEDIEGGGVAQGDIRVPRHPDEEDRRGA